MADFSLHDNDSFNTGLDAVRKEFLKEENTNKLVVGSTVTVSTGLSIGYVLWMMNLLSRSLKM